MSLSIRYLVDLEAIEIEREGRARTRMERVQTAINGTRHLMEGLDWTNRVNDDKKGIADRYDTY